MRKRSKFDVGWQDWAVAIALGAIVLLLAALALVTYGGWSHQRDVARAMEPKEAAPAEPKPQPPPAAGGAGGEHAPAARR
jgi:heme/copper-type cytochrome/quinol oxidase subunit 1